MGPILQARVEPQLVDANIDVSAITAVNHAVQVVAPTRQAPGAPVAQRHAGDPTEPRADLIDLTVRNIPNDHCVRRVAELMVPYDDAQAFDKARVKEVSQPADDGLLVHTERSGDLGIRTGLERQAVLNDRDEATIERVGGTLRWRRRRKLRGIRFDALRRTRYHNENPNSM